MRPRLKVMCSLLKNTQPPPAAHPHTSTHFTWRANSNFVHHICSFRTYGRYGGRDRRWIMPGLTMPASQPVSTQKPTAKVRHKHTYAIRTNTCRIHVFSNTTHTETQKDYSGGVNNVRPTAWWVQKIRNHAGDTRVGPHSVSGAENKETRWRSNTHKHRCGIQMLFNPPCRSISHIHGDRHRNECVLYLD